MNHLSDLANEVINHWTAENVTGRRGEAVVIPEDFLNEWALPRYGSFIEAMGTDKPEDVGTIFRDMIQEKIGQKIIDLRTLPAEIKHNYHRRHRRGSEQCRGYNTPSSDRRQTTSCQEGKCHLGR